MPLPLPTRGLNLWALGTSLLVSTRFSDALRASPGSLSLSGAAQQQQHQHYGASSRLPPSCHARHDYSTVRRRARNAANTAPCAFSGSKLDSSRLRCCPGRLLVMSSSSSGDGAMEGGVDGSDDEEDENEMATVVEGEVVTSAQELGGGEEELKAVTQETSALEKGMKGKKKRRRPRLEGEKLRDELMGREKQEEDAVLEVNTQFYRGRAYKEIDELKEVWDQSDLSECIRSVGSVLKGYNNIIEEYKTDFVVAKKNDLPGLRPFKIRDLKVQTCGTLAWITCVEDMRNPYKPYPKTVQLVTNVFRKTSNGWKLTRHHASDRDVPAGKAGTGGSSSKSLSGSVGKQPGTSDGQGGMLSHFVDENGQVTELSARMFRVADGEIRPVDISELTGEASGGGGDEDDIDLSKGEWISIGDEDVSGGNIPPFLKKLITDKVKAAVNKGDAGAIMRSPESFKKKLTRELKDELGGGLKNGSDKRGGIGSTNSSRRHGDDDDEEEEAEMKQARELTRETVDAVRQLAQAGKISEKDKRLLLADVILNASSEGPSITEVAFQVLVGGGEEAGRDFDANGCEEFVDQCKALAVQLAQEQSKRRPWWKFWAWFRR